MRARLEELLSRIGVGPQIVMFAPLHFEGNDLPNILMRALLLQIAPLPLPTGSMMIEWGSLAAPDEGGGEPISELVGALSLIAKRVTMAGNGPLVASLLDIRHPQVRDTVLSAALAALGPLYRNSLDGRQVVIHVLQELAAALRLRRSTLAQCASVFRGVDKALETLEHQDVRLLFTRTVHQVILEAVESPPEQANLLGLLADSHGRAGRIHESQDHLEDALTEYRQSSALWERLVSLDPSNLIYIHELGTSYIRIGDALQSCEDYDDAVAVFKQALFAWKSLAIQEQDNIYGIKQVGITLTWIGSILENQGLLDQALEQFKSSLTIWLRLADFDKSTDYWLLELEACHMRIGTIRLAQGEQNEALIAFRKRSAVWEALVALEPDNSEWLQTLVTTYYSVAGILKSLGKYDVALAELRKSLSVCERLAALSPNDIIQQLKLSRSYFYIAELLEAKGDLKGALAAHRNDLAVRARLVAQNQSPSDFCHLAHCYLRIGGLLEAHGNLDEALVEYCMYITLSKCIPACNPEEINIYSRMVAQGYYRIGKCHLAKKEYLLALNLFGEVKIIMMQQLAASPNNSDLRRSLLLAMEGLAFAHKALGDCHNAIIWAQSALDIGKSLVAELPLNNEWNQDINKIINAIENIKLHV